MLKKLFIAVCFFGLVLSFSGIADASDDRPALTQDRVKVDGGTTPSTAALEKAKFINPAPAQKQFASERLIDLSEARTPQVSSTDTTACWYYLDYVDWVHFGGSVNYFDIYGGDTYALAVRYDIPKYHYATITGSEFRLAESSANSGGCDLEVGVWTDVGGLPGTLLFADTIPASALGHPVSWAGYWVDWTFSTPIVIEGETNFHISWGPTDDSPTDDYVEMLMTKENDYNVDYVTSGRNSMKAGTTWYADADFWASGEDADHWMDVTYCVEFSDCYTIGLPDPGYVSGWAMPDPAWSDPAFVWNGVGQRFVSEGPDTLTMLRFFHLDYGEGLYPTTGSDVIIELWDDDGTGQIDYASGPFNTKTITGTLANLFPQTGGALGNPGGFNWIYVDYTADNLVLYGAWHATARMSSDDPVNGALNFPQTWEWDDTHFAYTDGSGASVQFTGDAMDWHRQSTPGSTWDNEVGWEMMYMIRPYLCRDEFYDCQFFTPLGDGLYAGGLGADWLAQRVPANPVNDPAEVYWQILSDPTYYGYPVGTNGYPDVAVEIYTATPTGPGTVVFSDTMLNGTYIEYPGWNVTVIPDDIWLYGDFYVGVKNVSADVGTDWFWQRLELAGSENGTGAMINFDDGTGWYDAGQTLGIDFGWGPPWDIIDLNFYVDFCSIPVEERPCGVSDWVTMHHDFQRSNASLTAIGDAQCKLNLNASWEHPTLIGQFVGPIIYDNMLITTFRSATLSEYHVQDLITKADIYTFSYPNNVQGEPTVAYIDALSAPIMFVTTGADDDLVQAINLDDGSVVYTITDAIATLEGDEKCLFGNFMVLTIGADQVLYFTTNYGQVIAVNAATGAAYWPAAYKPAAMGPVNNRSGATDGEGLLFYGYATVFGGDIVCLDAATGAEVWLLSTDGLKGNDAYGGGVPIEQFNAGLSYDAETGKIYAVSACTGDHPRSGCFYIIDAATGVTDEYTACQGLGWAQTPTIDKRFVYVPTNPRWVPFEISDCMLQSFRKADGGLQWCIKWGENGSDEFSTGAPVLTCEPLGLSDLLFVFTGTGHLRCISVDDGAELFYRRITETAFGGASGAIAEDAAGDAHIVFQSSLGGVFDLTMGSATRPRLDVLSASNRQPVPFGSDANYVVTFPDVFANSGCADLVVTMDVSETSNGSTGHIFKTVRDDLNNEMANIADKLASDKLTRMSIAPFETSVATDKGSTLSKTDGLNQAALADMSWINTPTLNYTVAPGDAQDIVVEVDQPAVGRGVFDFYCAFTTMNDPDYWLDTFLAPANPEVMLTFLGGCLKESNDLEFGDGLINYRQVYNSSRIVDSDDAGFEFDGFAPLFQGMYVMGVSEKRIALNTTAWHGGPPEDQYTSWVPDLVEGQCIPVLTEGVGMGTYFDGTSNHTIYANVVEYNAIDSVQNFDDGAGGWDWTDYFAPFDPDSTMGLRMNHRVIGCYDFGDPGTSPVGMLGDATIDIIEFTERNGNSLPGWGINCYYDWDFRTGSTVDTTQLDRSISTAWTYSVVDENGVGGIVKLPFSFCTNEADPNYVAPMKSAYAIDQREGMFNEDFLDSAWLYTQLPPGEYSHVFEDPSDQNFDMAASYTFANHDFSSHETYTLVLANFILEDYAGPFTSAGPEMVALANQLNKFMGYGRGDLNNDNVINLADVVYLTNWINYGGTGPIPFEYLANVNTNTSAPYYTQDDVVFLADYYFNGGPCPGGILKHTSKSIVEE